MSDTTTDAWPGIVDLADEILDLVRKTDVGGRRADSAAVVMHGAYLQAYRRLSRIRDLAAADAGEEAFILARSLLSMAVRAIWVDQPTESAEREQRFKRWLRRQVQDELDEAEGLAALGDEPAGDIKRLREQLDNLKRELEGVPPFPTDRKMIEDELGLRPHLWRLYRPSSSFIHFSLRQAIDEIRAAATAGEELTFDRPTPDLAREALALSVLTYGLLIELSEMSVGHGLGPRVLELVTEWPAFAATRTEVDGGRATE